jgi:hypothetical protein
MDKKIIISGTQHAIDIGTRIINLPQVATKMVGTSILSAWH